MIRALFVMLMATPAAAQDLPFAVGDRVVQRATLEGDKATLVLNPLPKSEWACYAVERITPNDLDLRLEAGFHDMEMPLLPGQEPQPFWANVGTGVGISSSDGLFLPCPPLDPTGYTTVFLNSCDIARLYERVPNCKGRPLPPD